MDVLAPVLANMLASILASILVPILASDNHIFFVYFSLGKRGLCLLVPRLFHSNQWPLQLDAVEYQIELG